MYIIFLCLHVYCTSGYTYYIYRLGPTKGTVDIVKNEPLLTEHTHSCCSSPQSYVIIGCFRQRALTDTVTLIGCDVAD